MKILFSLFLILIITISINAQEQADTLVKITLSDNSELVGKIIKTENDTIYFKTSLGHELSLPKASITEIQYEYNSERENLDPLRTKLFFAPTARTLNSGEFNLSILEIFFPAVSIGITDYITFGGGFSLIPGALEQLAYLVPKVRFLKYENLYLSSGLFYLLNSNGNAGLLFVSSTYEIKNVGLTGGICYGLVSGKVQDYPGVILGIDITASNHVKFISENWFLPDTKNDLLSFGIRFYGSRLAADLGMIYVLNTGYSGWPLFPWLSIGYTF